MWIMIAIVTIAVAAIPTMLALPRRKVRLRERHVLITGGSTGIGFALAKELAKRECRVSLLARTQSKLEAAAEELQTNKPKGTICTFAADVTRYEQITAAVAAAEKQQGPVDLLVCNAGLSYPGRFLEQELALFHETMELNYFGQLHAAKAVIPGMVARRQGHVVFVSSAAGLVGLMGYTTYAPTKWALRGLADCLRNELSGTGVSIHIAYPPDTDTPGYANESLTKPQECHDISRAVGDVLWPPEKVAACIAQGLERGAYHLPTPDVGQNFLRSAMAGATPRPYPLIVECLLAPLLTVALYLLRWLMDSVVVRAARKRARPQ